MSAADKGCITHDSVRIAGMSLKQEFDSHDCSKSPGRQELTISRTADYAMPTT